MQSGSCLCGAVRFDVEGAMTQPSVCHCGQCRKQSGHLWASTVVARENLRLSADDTLHWYAASGTARRGFCRICGSFLFWKHNDEDTISVAMSAFDTSTGLTIGKHIFVADKGDYYGIDDGLPQQAQ